MTQHKNLFEFVCTLIDIQIKKYVSLPTMGIGPDALMNATLVLNETNELLDLAERLLVEMETPSSTDNFPTLFSQIKFYVEQEYIRGYAGWLLDKNGIHTGLLSRVEEQLKELKHIGESAHIDCSSDSPPLTEVQKQCEYDSIAIAFYILDTAKKLKDNPEMELDNPALHHALGILKRNALTRYAEEKFAKPIAELHQKYDIFLKQSNRQKSTLCLSKEDAKTHERQNRTQWDALLDRYKKLEPDSDLFSTHHEWYKIGRIPSEKTKTTSPYSSKNMMFFGGVTLSCVAISMLMAYFYQQNEGNSLQSAFKF